MANLVLDPKLSDFQLLAIVNGRTGVQIILRPFEKLVRVIVDADKPAAKLLITGHHYTETAREYRLTGKYSRLYDITLGTYQMLEVPDPDFVMTSVQKYDLPSASDRVAHSAWERMCHRPGPGRDSYKYTQDSARIDSERAARLEEQK